MKKPPIMVTLVIDFIGGGDQNRTDKAFAEIIRFTSPRYKQYQALINKPLPQKSYHLLYILVCG
jgi:hypothetical protein